MFGRFALLGILGAIYHQRGAAYWASAPGRRMARDIARLVYTNIFFVATLSIVATKWELFWLHIAVAAIAIPMYAARGWRPALAVAAGDWGIAGNAAAAEYLARAIASLLFLAGWWNILAPTPALNFHDHPATAAMFTLGVWLFILRKEFVSPSLKETTFFKLTTAMIAGPCFALLVWWRVTPIIAAGHLAVVTAPAGTTLNDVIVAAKAVSAERTTAVGDFSETAAWHAADRSWPRGRRLEVGVPTRARVDAGVKLANDMPCRVVVSGPAGSTVTVGLFDRGLGPAGGWAQTETVTVGKPIDLTYLGLRPAEVWVDGDPANAVRVKFDRGVR